MYGGKSKGAIDLLFSRICESAVPASRCFSEEGRRAIEERKKKALKGWAIATGNWHTDLSAFTDDKEPFAQGTDSKVYTSKDGGDEKISKLVTAIKNQLVYGKEEPTERDILRHAEYNNRIHTTDSRRVGDGDRVSGGLSSAQHRSNQGRSREDSEGDSGNVRDIAERQGSGVISDEGVTMVSDLVSKAIG